MKKKLILFTEVYFPTGNALVPILYRLLKNFDCSEKTILCKKEKNDINFPKYLNKDEEKIQIKEIIYSKIKISNNKILNKLFDKIIKNLINIKYNFCYLLMLRKKYDYIITSTMPRGYHKYGFIYKLFYPKSKWVAFFSDPYSNSPFERFNYSLKRDYLYIIRAIYKYYCKILYEINKYFLRIEEKLVFKYADKIIYVSEAQKKFCYKIEDENNKAIVIPFYYLSEWKKEIVKNTKIKNILKKNVIKFIHPGNIYGNRKPDEFFKALFKFKEKIHFYNCGNFDEELLKKYELEDTITSLGNIKYEVLLENINEADFMIVIDSFFENIKNPYMPSKVVDAMYFNKPIIAITNKGTELDIFCKKTGNLSIENNKEEIEKKLYELLNGKIEIKPDYSMFCDLKFRII